MIVSCFCPPAALCMRFFFYLHYYYSWNYVAWTCVSTGLTAEHPSGRLGRSGAPSAPRDHPLVHQADLSKAGQGENKAPVEVSLMEKSKTSQPFFPRVRPDRASSRT